jgi:hypothetical protein
VRHRPDPVRQPGPSGSSSSRFGVERSDAIYVALGAIGPIGTSNIRSEVSQWRHHKPPQSHTWMRNFEIRFRNGDAIDPNDVDIESARTPTNRSNAIRC